MAELLSEDEDEAQVLYAKGRFAAEHLRAILAMWDIRAAVLQRDPLQFAAATVGILVAAHDCARAREALAAAQTLSRCGDWACPNCREEVPANFDLCWNCGEGSPQSRPGRSEPERPSAVETRAIAIL